MSSSSSFCLSDPHLPAPHQTWIHAVDNRNMLEKALQESSITAIEIDLVMGDCLTTDHTNFAASRHRPQSRQVILAHPPCQESDLAMTDLFEQLAATTTGSSNGLEPKAVVKLDFKQFETVAPTLEVINKMQIPSSTTLVLNADILPGPGQDANTATQPAFFVDAVSFLETCSSYIQRGTKEKRLALSLGWKVDWRHMGGYTTANAQAMRQALEQYQTQFEQANVGIIYAVNARQLVQSLGILDNLLVGTKSSQFLVWTGKGEPPISEATVQRIKEHYRDYLDQVGFDCQIVDENSE